MAEKKSRTGRSPTGQGLVRAQERAARSEYTVTYLFRRGQRKAERLLGHLRQNILHYMQAIWEAEVPSQRYLRLRSQMYPKNRPPPVETVVIPSDAVYIEALPGTHPLLETFKLRHREVDVQKAHQEVVAQEIENARRLLLLGDERYGDPKIEKMVVADSALVAKISDALADEPAGGGL